MFSRTHSGCRSEQVPMKWAGRRTVAERLNKHPNRKLVKFLVPTRGFSTLGAAADRSMSRKRTRAFVDELRKHFDPEIQVHEVDTHLNTPEFATAIVQAFREVFALAHS